jgi:hypothetical protein
MTSTPENLGEIFKRDTKGWVRVPRARREMLLDELERSGGSAAQLLATWGSNIRHRLTGFQNGGNKSRAPKRFGQDWQRGTGFAAVLARPEECDKPDRLGRASVPPSPSCRWLAFLMLLLCLKS